MKLFKIFFLFILFGSSLNISAQQTQPMPILQGYIQVLRTASDPDRISTAWSFGGNNFSSSSFNNPSRPGTMPFFFSNRLTANFVYVVEPSAESRGDVSYFTVSCTNCLMAQLENPLSTRFEIKFDDFRIPKFPKVDAPNNVEIIVPFTVTGRVSTFSLSPTPGISVPINGTGRARLRFARSNTRWNQVQLTNASFGFGTQAP